ncbi:uncharacterized protein EI90DRAFT_3038249, partial [Cantharellus anzutake]|uniref:uncharacterized protein n=1 Tax=Cantharellus anzutake TaxID=1750568 RepID=UPI001905FE20
MFKLPQADSQSELPSVTMTEDARTLELLLKIVYPIEAGPKEIDLELAMNAYRAAEKFQFHKVSSTIHNQLQSILKTVENPLEAWAIAVQLNFPQASRDAELRFISMYTRKCFHPLPKHLNMVPVEKFALLIDKKEYIIEQARRKLKRALTFETSHRPPCQCDPCPLCNSFAHIFVSMTAKFNPFNPRCTSTSTLQKCFQQATAHHSCRRWARPPNQSDQEMLELVLTKVLLSAEP